MKLIIWILNAGAVKGLYGSPARMMGEYKPLIGGCAFWHLCGLNIRGRLVVVITIMYFASLHTEMCAATGTLCSQIVHCQFLEGPDDPNIHPGLRGKC